MHPRGGACPVPAGQIPVAAHDGAVLELVADGRPAGFAVWFYSYSTWQAKNGLYLEDLYVKPDMRGLGLGKIMLRLLNRW